MGQEYRLLVATTNDIPTLAAIETEAIQPSPLNSVFFHNWAGLEAQSAMFGSQTKEHMGKPNVQVMKAVTGSSRDKAIVHGFVVWAIVDDSEQARSVDLQAPAPVAIDYDSNSAGVKYIYDKIPERLEVPMDALNMDFCSVAFANTAQLKVHTVAGRQRYAYLHRLFVRPEAQGSGLGSQMMRWCLEQADQQKLDTLLICVPHPHDFYLKHGFHDTAYWDVDLRPWGPRWGGFGMFRFQGMVRPHRSEQVNGDGPVESKAPAKTDGHVL